MIFIYNHNYTSTKSFKVKDVGHSKQVTVHSCTFSISSIRTYWGCVFRCLFPPQISQSFLRRSVRKNAIRRVLFGCVSWSFNRFGFGHSKTVGIRERQAAVGRGRTYHLWYENSPFLHCRCMFPYWSKKVYLLSIPGRY